MASLPLPLWFPPLTRTNHLRPFTITAGLAARRVPESGGDCGSADIRLGVAAAAFLFYWPFGLRILCALVAALIEWSCACLAFHFNSSFFLSPPRAGMRVPEGVGVYFRMLRWGREVLDPILGSPGVGHQNTHTLHYLEQLCVLVRE